MREAPSSIHPLLILSNMVRGTTARVIILLFKWLPLCSFHDSMVTGLIWHKLIYRSHWTASICLSRHEGAGTGPRILSAVGQRKRNGAAPRPINGEGLLSAAAPFSASVRYRYGNQRNKKARALIFGRTGFNTGKKQKKKNGIRNLNQDRAVEMFLFFIYKKYVKLLIGIFFRSVLSDFVVSFGFSRFKVV